MAFINNELSVLLIGVVPVPITPAMRIFSTEGDASFDYKYDKLSSEAKDNYSPTVKASNLGATEYYEDMGGASSRSIEFAIPFDRVSPTTKALSLVFPIFELVAEYIPKTVSFKAFKNANVKSVINKQKSLISYYDATGFCTFFNYKLSSVRFTENKNEDIIYLSITATKDSSVTVPKQPAIIANKPI